MVTPRKLGERRTSCRREGGFTLVEVIVALAVLSVAVTIFISLYSSSIDLAATGQNRVLASTLAEEQMSAITQNPLQFFWYVDPEGPEGRLLIMKAEDDPKTGNPVSPPSALPAEMSGRERDENTYARFRWQAFAEPGPSGNYYEVTVAVNWKDRGRRQVLAFTSSVAGHLVPKAEALEVKAVVAPEKTIGAETDSVVDADAAEAGA